MDGIAQHFLRETGLLVSLGVHEVVEIAIGVHVLDGGVVQTNVLHALAGAKGLVDGGAAAQVSDLGLDDGRAAGRFVVLVFQHPIEIAIEFKSYAFFQLVRF